MYEPPARMAPDVMFDSGHDATPATCHNNKRLSRKFFFIIEI